VVESKRPWRISGASVQQPCSNVVAVGEKLDLNRIRAEIRRLVAEAPDEPTYCELKEKLSYSTKKEKGELVKDVSSFSNADLEVLGGYGYIIFGVSNDGRVVGIGDIPGDPSAEARQIVNGHLDRAVNFEYVTCEVDDKAGGTKRVAAIVVPDSRRRPHVVSREIKENLNNRDKFWLRKGEVWVRKTGGRALATAQDLDEIYEGKLRRLVDDQVRPLQERVQLLEGDLREQRSTVPELGFGFAVAGSRDPSPRGRPYPVLNSLIDVSLVDDEVSWAEKQIQIKKAEMRPYSSAVTLGPSVRDYERYKEELGQWLVKLENLLVVDFVLVNTGRGPAEDVEVVLEVPVQLRPSDELPDRPRRPKTISLAPVELIPTCSLPHSRN
jgi:hypothetical protein